MKTVKQKRAITNSANAGLGAWISVKDRLPPFNKYVACVNIENSENTGGAFDTCVHQCAYLSKSKYWSVYGRIGLCLEAFTHWCSLPKVPDKT